MGRGKNTMGAVVDELKGYKIRQMMSSKSVEGTKKTILIPTGKFGVYAGRKKFISEISKLSEGRPFIEKLMMENFSAKKKN